MGTSTNPRTSHTFRKDTASSKSLTHAGSCPMRSVALVPSERTQASTANGASLVVTEDPKSHPRNDGEWRIGHDSLYPTAIARKRRHPRAYRGPAGDGRRANERIGRRLGDHTNR